MSEGNTFHRVSRLTGQVGSTVIELDGRETEDKHQALSYDQKNHPTVTNP